MIPVHRIGILVALVGVLVAGCGEHVPAGVTAPDLTGSIESRLGAPGLVQCAPLAAESVTRLVGPDGGTVSIGPHRLVVPSGALTEAVAITAVLRPEPVRRVRFQPEGLTFTEPARLTMSYADCGLAGLLPLGIAYTSSALDILAHLPSLVNALAREVSADLHHFSNYAIAW